MERLSQTAGLFSVINGLEIQLNFKKGYSIFLKKLFKIFSARIIVLNGLGLKPEILAILLPRPSGLMITHKYGFEKIESSSKLFQTHEAHTIMLWHQDEVAFSNL